MTGLHQLSYAEQEDDLDDSNFAELEACLLREDSMLGVGHNRAIDMSHRINTGGYMIKSLVCT